MKLSTPDVDWAAELADSTQARRETRLHYATSAFEFLRSGDFDSKSAVAGRERFLCLYMLSASRRRE